MLKDTGKKRSIVFLAFVLVAATVYYFFISQGSPVFRFSAKDRTFGFQGSKNTQVFFSFDTLEELSIHEGGAEDFGTPLEGGKVWGGYLYGTWKSDVLGEYEAFVTDRFGTCIVAKDAEKTAVFNASNAETTRSLYQQLDSFWRGDP